MNHQQQGVCSTKTHKKHMEKVEGEAVLRKWQDDHGLWRVPVKGGANGEEANTIAFTKQELIEVLHKVLTYHQLNKPFNTYMQA